MSTVAIASVAIGINDSAYCERWTARPSIRFAEADAKAITDYVRHGWPSARPEHVATLLAGEATVERIRETFETLSALGAIDLAVVFLSGHGIQDAVGNAAFCTSDGSVDSPGIDANELTALFSGIDASRILLILDCCYAQSIVSDCAYFNELGGAVSRLYICSSDSAERSWEDEQSGHGVFTAAFIGMLSHDRPEDQVSGIRVQEDLIPQLRARVATAVDALNRSTQQPVAGGLARDDIVLPICVGTGMWQPPTPLQAIRRRFVRFARAGAIIGLLTLLVLQTMTYHIGLNRTGAVGISTGPPWLRGIWPAALADRVDLGISAAELRTDPAVRWAMSRGDAWGIWTHRESDGTRKWARSVLPYLNDRARHQMKLLLFGEPPSLESTEVFDVQPWQILFAADAARLMSSPAPTNLAQTFPVAPTEFEDYDYEALNRSTDGTRTLINAAASLALSSPDQGGDAMERVRRLVAYRMARASDVSGELLAEASEVAGAYARVARWLPQTDTILAAPVSALQASYAADRLLAAYVCGYVYSSLSTDEQSQVLEVLFNFVETFDADTPDDALTAVQNLALDGLLAVFRAESLRAELLDRLCLIAGDDSSFERIPSFREFLRDLARHQPLPGPLRTRLVNHIQTSDDEFVRLTAMQVLAANLIFVAADERDAISDAIRTAGDRDYTFDGKITPTYALVLADLIAADIEIPDFLPMVQRQLDASWSAPPPSIEYELLGALVEWSDMPFAVAIAVAYQETKVTVELKRQLRSIALLRPQADGRTHLISFLARRKYENSGVSADRIRDELATHPRSALERQLETECAAHVISGLSNVDRQAVLSRLRKLWASEQEPEVKHAIGKLSLMIW